MNNQVAAFHQLDPHLPRQKRMLEVSGVVNTGGQQNDHGLVPPFGRERAQSGQQGLAIVIDGRTPHCWNRRGKMRFITCRLVSMYETPLGTRRLSSSTTKRPSGIADQVGADNGDINILRDMQAAHLPPEVLAAVNHLARDHTVGEDAPFVINIA